MAIPVAIGWSGGKDSALALNALLRDEQYRVAGLVTTVTRDFGRISMHGVRRELLHQQAAALQLPLTEVFIPRGASNSDYESAMAAALTELRDRGIGTVAFGDLFLADIRAYRERQVAGLGMECLFPVWGEDTAELAERFIADGFRATICCVDPARLPQTFCGRAFDQSLLDDLPEGVDPCGENGEFHTFVSDGPGWSRPVDVECGEVVSRDGFWYCDLIPRAFGAQLLPA